MLDIDSINFLSYLYFCRCLSRALSINVSLSISLDECVSLFSFSSPPEFVDLEILSALLQAQAEEEAAVAAATAAATIAAAEESSSAMAESVIPEVGHIVCRRQSTHPASTAAGPLSHYLAAILLLAHAAVCALLASLLLHV